MPTAEEILRKTFKDLEEMLDETSRERGGVDRASSERRKARPPKDREVPLQGRQRREK